MSTRCLSYVEVARESEGATVAVGGGRAKASKGNFVAPTLYLDARNDMKIAQEEIFGPVLTMIPFADETGSARASPTTCATASPAICGPGMSAARTASRKALEAGMIWVNSENVRHLPTPFGGVKSSGIGRDGGDYSFDFYMETKNIAIALDNHKIPKIGA